MPESVIRTSVDDSEFHKFAEELNKQHDTLDLIFGSWGKINAAAKSTNAEIRAQTAALLAMQSAIHKQTVEWKEQEKEEKKLLDEKKKEEAAANRLLRLEKQRRDNMKALWEDTKNIASKLTDIATSIGKFTLGTVGGLAGFGDLFGLTSLASGVTTTRRTAAGIGTTTGRMQAFDVNYRRFFADPTSIMQNISEAQSDYTRRAYFAMMGIPNAGSQDPAELSVSMMRRARGLMQNLSRDQMTRQYLEPMGLLNFYTMDQLKAIHNMSELDIKTAEEGYKKDKESFDIQDKLNQKWADLDRTLAESKRNIENAFIKALTPLTGNIEELSKAVAKTILQFLTPQNIAKVQEEASEAIKWLTTTLNSPDFQRGISNFAATIPVLADKLYDLMVKLKWITPSPEYQRRAADELTIQQNTRLIGILDRAGKLNPFYNPATDRTRNIAMAQIAKAQADLAKLNAPPPDAAGGGLPAGPINAPGGRPAGIGTTQGGGHTVGHLIPFGGTKTASQAQLIKWYMEAGLTKAQAAAWVANIGAESGYDPIAIGDLNPKTGQYEGRGLFMLHPDRQELFNQWAASQKIPYHSLEYASAREQVLFSIYEAKQKGVWQGLDYYRNDPAGGAAYLTRTYETPKDIPGQSAVRADLASRILLTVQVSKAPGSDVPVNVGLTTTPAVAR